MRPSFHWQPEFSRDITGVLEAFSLNKEKQAERLQVVAMLFFQYYCNSYLLANFLIGVLYMYIFFFKFPI